VNPAIAVVLEVLGIAGMFLLLIAPHEGGHFIVAKLCKVRVIEFSVGAGTRLWSTTRNGTLYAIRLLPILGYVRMGGMEAGDFDEPNGFHSKHPAKRIAILAAGPAANFLVAMVLIAGATMTQLNSDPGLVLGVVKGSPALAAGLQAGDHIATVDGKPIRSPENIQQAEVAAGGKPVVVTGTHGNGQAFSVTVTPKCSQDGCQMGVGIARITTPLTAIGDGIAFPWQAFQVIVQGLGSLVTGQIQGGLFGNRGLTGPIGIAAITVDAVNAGPPAYVTLVALLSVALGVTNLLPLLALDGGRIVVVVLEWLRRRPFDRNMELNFQRWGLAALLALAAIISFLDIQRLATGTFPGVG
jgi:regulator of sigma E protease